MLSSKRIRNVRALRYSEFSEEFPAYRPRECPIDLDDEWMGILVTTDGSVCLDECLGNELAGVRRRLPSREGALEEGDRFLEIL